MSKAIYDYRRNFWGQPALRRHGHSDKVLLLLHLIREREVQRTLCMLLNLPCELIALIWDYKARHESDEYPNYGMILPQEVIETCWRG
jgi:hypothetical protein